MSNDKNYFKRLASDIVVQAAKDYRKLLSKEDKLQNDNLAIMSLEEFFKGDAFKMLSDADGTYIMNKIKNECNSTNRA